MSEVLLATQGLAVKAIRGNAILFYATKSNGDVDDNSLHGSCPTTKGDKYSATKWVCTCALLPLHVPHSMCSVVPYDLRPKELMLRC